MTPTQKLRFIQQITGRSQAELASRLGVTFAALNRWINGHAKPRKSSLARIEALYLELTGTKREVTTSGQAKDAVLAKMKTAHPRVLAEILGAPDIVDQFVLSLTYHSNRIEGSTLSEAETAAIIFDNATLLDKSLTEHLEAKNHQTALLNLFEHISKGQPIDQKLIFKLHSVLMNSIRPDAGEYRRHAVRIVGTHVPTANFLKIEERMRELSIDIKKRSKNSIRHIAEIHSRFEQIHPFSDGNGRVGRLLMHAMLLKENLPPAVIVQQKKRDYIEALSHAQLRMDHQPFVEFVQDAVLAGFSILERS